MLDEEPVDDILSNNNSPTKPLNFPQHKSFTEKGLSLRSSAKDFNSSSDTYISEQSPQVEDKKNEISLARNFELNDSDVPVMIKNEKEIYENFEIISNTPVTSTTDLLAGRDKNKSAHDEPSNEKTLSPTRSIMKKTKDSPMKEKNVAFASNSPEIHHYQPKLYPDSETNAKKNNLNHKWKEVTTAFSTDEETSTPPVPPLHTDNMFNEVMKQQDPIHQQDVDRNSLRLLKAETGEFSTLPLNERLEVFLTMKGEDNGELLEHLDKLNEVVKQKTEFDIHNLSQAIQHHRKELKDNTEKPLKSLAESSEVQLMSESSHSSLHSLMEGNRELDIRYNTPIPSKGVELNDGINGFSNQLVEYMIERGIPFKYGMKMSETNDSVPDNVEQHIKEESENSGDDIFHDSFDTNTELSIMRLLDTTPMKPENPSFDNTIPKKDSKTFIEPPREDCVTKVEEYSQIIKDEHSRGYLNSTKAKKEEEFEGIDALNKESNDTELSHQNSSQGGAVNDECENINYFDYDTQPKIESVSDYGVTHKLIKLIKSCNGNGGTSDAVPEHSTADNSLESEEDRFTLRDCIDSDWKFEDSNDGDKEDNGDTRLEDSTILHEVDLNAVLSKGAQRSDSCVSKECKSLAPPPVHAVTKNEDVKEVDRKSSSLQTDDDVLANSSNIAPPEGLTLPSIDIRNDTSLKDIENGIKNFSLPYEESLSAEHDPDKPMVDYISIWHSQERKKSLTRLDRRNGNGVLPLTRSSTNRKENVYPEKFRSISQKRFKEVNVTSRKIVNTLFEDLYLSAFLPEISEDSGFNDQLKFFNRASDQSFVDHSSVFDKRNIGTVVHKSRIISSLEKESRNCRSKVEDSMTFDRIQSTQPIKKSKFRVPSFDIKRSNSVLSPKNQYDDIFDDVLGEPPTIKSQGMKTLPSMNSDDVRRILASKRSLGQDEYTEFKNVGGRMNSATNQPEVQYDKLQQAASLCNVSLETESTRDLSSPFCGNLKLRMPSPFLSKDLHFDELGHPKIDFLQNFSKLSPDVEGSLREPAKLNIKDPRMPSPELRLSPEMVADNKAINSDHQRTPLNSNAEIFGKDDSPHTPTRKHKYIKISSPIKFVKTDSGVVAKSATSPVRILGNKDVEVSQFRFPEESHLLPPCRYAEKRGEEECGVSLLENPKVRKSPNKETKETNDSSFYLESPSATDSMSKGIARHEPKLSTVTVPTVPESELSHGQTSQDHEKIVSANASNSLIGDTNKISNPLKPDSFERGRLFFKVVSIKGIDLSDIAKHHAEVSITLDNGKHCIKSSNYRLYGHNLLINKEFEFKVEDSLEFILTAKIDYEKPKGTLVEVNERKVVKSKNRISRLFGSKDVITTTKFVPKEAKDTWSGKFAQDGSFARCYVDLEQYEEQITGVVCNYNLNCYNEWENAKHTAEINAKRKPYVISQLEVRMLYIPRAQEHEVLPISIKNAYETVHDVLQLSDISYEGYMYQEGGDCETLKRRFFTLHGTSLVAHNDANLKSRAKINLSKVVDVIYLKPKDINENTEHFRNFSDGVLLPHSFKIKFANGETINFGAPNEEVKQHWVRLLETIAYRNKVRRQHWVVLMLQKNRI